MCIWCYNWTRSGCLVFNDGFCDRTGISYWKCDCNEYCTDSKEKRLCLLNNSKPALSLNYLNLSHSEKWDNIYSNNHFLHKHSGGTENLVLCINFLWGCACPQNTSHWKLAILSWRQFYPKVPENKIDPLCLPLLQTSSLLQQLQWFENFKTCIQLL